LQCVFAIKRSSEIVIRFVPSLLQRNKRLCYVFKLGLDSIRKKRRDRAFRLATPELLTNLPHAAVIVGSPNVAA